jgi:hypothetical protein
MKNFKNHFGLKSANFKLMYQKEKICTVKETNKSWFSKDLIVLRSLGRKNYVTFEDS